MIAVFKRELKSYFYSPLGYIFLAAMFFFSGQSFAMVLAAQSTMIEYVFSSMFSIVLMIIPLLTMRLLSEDKKHKTDQLLLTAPCSVTSIVIGKYLAALTMYLIAVSATLVYLMVMSTFTVPDFNLFVGNLVADILFAASIIAVGMFISSLTESQMIAGISTFAVMLFILSIDSLAMSIPDSIATGGFSSPIVSFLLTALKQFLLGLSFMSRQSDFITGILNLSHVIYYLSVVFLFNYLTVRVIEKRRWS